MEGVPHALSAFLVAMGLASFASAQPADSRAETATAPTVADKGTTAPVTETEDDKPKVVFRGSTLYWDHSATTSTLGVGSDYQSRNPTYEMAFGLRPRYYFRDVQGESVSARGDIALLREFTNSDATTREGEWTFTDAELWLAYAKTLNDTPNATTDLIIRAPQLVLPTSKVSASNGKILGIGLGIGVEQAVPLRGKDSGFLPGALARANARYRYQIASSVVPTSDSIDRVRLGPEGRSLPGDQLSGSAFPDHEISGNVSVEPEIVPHLSLLAELGLRYAHRRALDETVEICGVVSSGCVEVDTSADASRYSLASVFTLELAYELRDELTLSVGYANLASQLGADGQRRQPFYSQDARAYLTLTVALDALYLTATGRGERETAARNDAHRY